MDLDIGTIVLILIYVVNFFLILFIFFAEKSSPSKIMAWALCFLILPLLGFVLYLFIGQTFYSRYEYRKKGITDAQVEAANALDVECIELESKEVYKKSAMAMHAVGADGYGLNNDVKLYTLGQDKFDDFYKDLRNAKESIHIEYYIIRDDELGNELMDILTSKVKEGVEVKLLTDDFGVGKGPKKAIKEFRKAGGEFAVFHKVIALMLSPKKNNRNHRKIAVIDSTIGYCGGFNIGDEYLGKGPLGFWRDSAIRVQGATVYSLQMRFGFDWAYATNAKMDIDPKYYPESCMGEFGDDRITIVSGGPDVSDYNPVRMEYLELAKLAKKSIYIHSPYFILNESMIDALALAAARGVDVKVIIPDKPDHPFVFWNNIRCAYQMMSHGVKVYMYNRGFVHSKTMVVDGEYCSVGSANFDDRSLVLNFETNAMIFSKKIGSQMDAAFEDDLKYCTEYSVDEYQKTIHKVIPALRIAISRLFGNLA